MYEANEMWPQFLQFLIFKIRPYISPLNTADEPFQNFAEFLQDSLRSSDETKDTVPYERRRDLERFITSPESLHKMYEKVKSRYEKKEQYDF